MVLERELEAQKRQVEADRKQIEDLTRARDMLTKKMAGAVKDTEVQSALLKMNENTQKTLEDEANSYREEANKLRKQITEVEKERDRYINDAAISSQHCAQAIEDAKVAEAQVFDIKKKIADAETKLKQQQG